MSFKKSGLILKGYKPLVHIKDGLILYRRGYLWLYHNGTLEKVFHLHSTTWKDSFRFFVRLFRREPKLALPIDDTCFLLVWNKKILQINLSQNWQRCVHTARRQFSDPLNICSGSSEMTAIWGDYGPNPNREAVHIYGLTKSGDVEILYAFPKGSIRHIHNIIPRLNGGYYIFTGDTEPASGIYEADQAFENITPVLTGLQQSRAVVGFDTPQGLLYATDSVNEENYIYLLKGRASARKLDRINGSCIYGNKCSGGWLFSTTVEPDERNRGIFSWVSYKRGAGILSNEVHLLYVDENFNVTVMGVFQKDIFPMKMMQYGSIQFSRGRDGEIWIYPVAVRKYDGRAIYLISGDTNEQ